MNLVELNERTRELMLEEIQRDIKSGAIYQSPRLTATGLERFPDLLADAARDHDTAWLANQLSRGLMKSHEERRRRGGIGYTTVKVPYTALQTLAEGERNRYYIRTVCMVAIDDEIGEVEIYRAKEVENARSESARRIGTRMDAQQLLDELRVNSFVDNAMNLPQGPNSGLSARLPASN